MKRSCYCGRLRRKDVGLNITAQGWVQSKRDMGGVIFLDLRDREGVLQVVCDAALLSPEQFAMAEHIKNESVYPAYRCRMCPLPAAMSCAQKAWGQSP